MIFVLCNDCSFSSVVEEQYFLARKAKISWVDTNCMPDFERRLVLGFLKRDLKAEAEQANSGTTK